MNLNIPYPRMLDANLAYAKTLYPVSESVDLSLTPLSTATMVLPVGEEIPARTYVELFTSLGSIGIFRARTPQVEYGEGTSETELEHAITEIGDWIIRGKVEGNYTIRAAMRAVFAEYHGTRWQLGSVAALNNTNDDDHKIDISYDHDNVLEAMLEVLAFDEDCVMAFDFSTTPWTVSFRKIDSTTAETEGRVSRNIQSATITYDDTDLCTYAYYQYGGSSWSVFSAAQQYKDLYGRIEKVVDTDSDDSQNVAKNKARLYIKRNCQPRASIKISADDLYAITGRDEDKLELGRVYRLAAPEYGLDIKRYITGLSWDDVYGSPTSVMVTLGDDDPGLWGYMRRYTKKK